MLELTAGSQGHCPGRCYGSCSVSFTGNKGEGPRNSVSTPFTYLVQLHLVGREVILLGLSDSPGECTLSTQLRFLTLLKVGRPTEED